MSHLMGQSRRRWRPLAAWALLSICLLALPSGLVSAAPPVLGPQVAAVAPAGALGEPSRGHPMAGEAEAADEHAGQSPGLLWSIPFALLLACIALLPLIVPHWWESNVSKLAVAGSLAVPVTLYLLQEGHSGHVVHALTEYAQFIILLGSLFYVSGSIVLRGDIAATPAVNTGFLALGGLLASFVGTTGASMLLIRPILRTNAERHHVRHTVVFFIFIVSNIGGCLTPLGDPPLFLGFLRGVPFTWTFGLWKEWLAMNAVLLTLYYLWDRHAYATEEKRDLRRDETAIVPIDVLGRRNFLFLGGIVAAVAFLPTPLREMAMLAMIAASKFASDDKLREENQFSLHPILEVAALFIGIFLTMQPALMLLHVQGPHLGLDTPAKFFWGTGLLSSFLDNAPTYVTFFETAKTVSLPGAPVVAGVAEPFLVAISLGAVFMGANTYIGNGPNFMVKAVAEEAGVKMPSFLGYTLYSGAILIPLFALVHLLFFL